MAKGKNMKTFEIWEDGVKFASIEARTAIAALRKAVRAFPRNQCDYNEFSGSVTWRACEPGEMYSASAEVAVPGKSAHGCRFYAT